MSESNGPKDPKDDKLEGGDVVSLDEARKRADEKAAAQPSEGTPAAAAVLQPVMAAVLKELASLAGPDGSIKLGGEDAVARAKTAAVLKGIGAGLGAALAEAFGKWAEKITITANTAPAPSDPPPADDKPDPNKTN